MKWIAGALGLVAILALEGLSATNALAEERIVTIGTAGVTGVYYPAGGAICRLVNRGRKEHGVRCTVESTGGSINNLELLRKHDMDLGVVQSDLLYHAYNGSEIFADVGADKQLRAVFALHSEPFTVVARKDAHIRVFDDLKGKRIYLGPAGSGARATMDELMHRKGWTNKVFSQVVELKTDDQVKALCGGKIDALIYAGGHPNGAIQQLTSACQTRLVEVSGPAIEAMMKEYPFYSPAIIPGGMYVGNERDVRTFGVDAVLVASSELDDEIVYQITKAVFDNLDNFKTLHPVFATLEARRMVLDSEVAPLHAGARRYYMEKKLLPAEQ